MRTSQSSQGTLGLPGFGMRYGQIMGRGPLRSGASCGACPAGVRGREETDAPEGVRTSATGRGQAGVRHVPPAVPGRGQPPVMLATAGVGTRGKPRGNCQNVVAGIVGCGWGCGTHAIAGNIAGKGNPAGIIGCAQTAGTGCGGCCGMGTVSLEGVFGDGSLEGGGVSSCVFNVLRSLLQLFLLSLLALSGIVLGITGTSVTTSR